MNSIAEEVVKIYNESFSEKPKLYFSPGRINLIGEHIDYNDGFVMPAAINSGIYFAISSNNTDDIHLYARDFNEWFTINIREIKKATGWKNYVLSVINEFLLADKIVKGFNCVFGGDIPRGSGMSSSAALEGGIAFALNEIFDFGFDRIGLAKLCQRAEHNFPDVKCGMMDQFANMMGKKDKVILLDCQNLSYEYFPLKLDKHEIILINSKVHHSLASGEYNIRRQQCEEGLSILKQHAGIQSFRDIEYSADLFQYKDLMQAEVFDRCLFVVEEIERTKKAAILLQQNDLLGFGELMFQTHEGLRKLYNISCKELDFLVDEAGQHEAVIGSRMMGGGFGGCTINIVEKQNSDFFISKITSAYAKSYNITPEEIFKDV